MKTLLRHAPLGAAWCILHQGASRCLYKGCDKFAPFFFSVVPASHMRKGNTNFNAFWKWLQKKQRTITTLGGKSKFTIHAKGLAGTIISSNGKSHRFTFDDGKKTWKRFQSFAGKKQQLMTSSYALPNNKKKPLPQNWTYSPNKTCCPWIAAAIRDSLIGKTQNKTTKK